MCDVLQVDVLSKTGQVRLGLDIIPLLTNKFKRSLNVWMWHLKLQMLCNVNADVILSTFQDALKYFDKVTICILKNIISLGLESDSNF